MFNKNKINIANVEMEFGFYRNVQFSRIIWNNLNLIFI